LWSPPVCFYNLFVSLKRIRQGNDLREPPGKQSSNLQIKESTRFARILGLLLIQVEPGSPVISRWSQSPLMISVMISHLLDLLRSVQIANNPQTYALCD
jgi:hypothetical protein